MAKTEDLSAVELQTQVANWMASEGYPLEYFAASAFRETGLSVRQGGFTRRADSGPREIDVLAFCTRKDTAEPLVRVYTLVECKFSQTKPWVVFTSPSGRMAPPAVVVQNPATLAGEFALFEMAHDPELHKLDLFEAPTEPGFGGRQAFAGNKDVFYNALRSLGAGTRALVDDYDDPRRQERPSLVVAFPVLVIDAPLFEASYSPETDALVLKEVGHSRVHFQGDPQSRMRLTVDIVTKPSMRSFADKRSKDMALLLHKLELKCEYALDKIRRGESSAS